MNSIIKDDLFRYAGNRSFKSFLRMVLFTPSFQYLYFFRKTSLAKKRSVKFWFYKIILRHLMIKYGIQIPESVQIDRGLKIFHFGMLVMCPDAIIGKNCNIFQGVTIGYSKGKAPTIGNNVSIHPNAIVVGGIRIGNNVMIAPNAFVNFDVPDNAIVIGNPGKFYIKDYSPTAKHIKYPV